MTLLSEQPEPEPTSRESWEYLFDVAMISGTAIHIWNALVVVGLIPSVPVLIGDRWLNETVSNEAITFTIFTALLTLVETAYMLYSLRIGRLALIWDLVDLYADKSYRINHEFVAAVIPWIMLAVLRWANLGV